MYFVPQRSCRQYRLQSPLVVQSFLESHHTKTLSESVIGLDFDMTGNMSCDWIKKLSSDCWLYCFSEMTEMQWITLILEAVLNLLFQGHLTQLLLGTDRQDRDYDCECDQEVSVSKLLITQNLSTTL